MSKTFPITTISPDGLRTANGRPVTPAFVPVRTIHLPIGEPL